MNYFRLAVILVAISFPLLAHIDESVLPRMDKIYTKDFGQKVNKVQKKAIRFASEHRDEKLRVMTFNMLHNVKSSEEKLPSKHRWNQRKARLEEYLLFAEPDMIGSQELQEDQVQEVMSFLGEDYDYFGEPTRESEGKSDVNAIFFKRDRIELIDAMTIPYAHDRYQNGFTYCYFRDKLQGNEFVVINTKLTWGSAARRLAEATQLSQFSSEQPRGLPLIVLGDFNTYPFIQHDYNIFFDGEHIEKVLQGDNLKDAKLKSTFGHFGPLCTVTHSKTTVQPFAGPELTGFILDHILVNEHVDVFTHGVDIAKVDGEFPSDHFPLIADLFIRSDASLL